MQDWRRQCALQASLRRSWARTAGYRSAETRTQDAALRMHLPLCLYTTISPHQHSCAAERRLPLPLPLPLTRVEFDVAVSCRTGGRGVTRLCGLLSFPIFHSCPFLVSCARLPLPISLSSLLLLLFCFVFLFLRGFRFSKVSLSPPDLHTSSLSCFMHACAPSPSPTPLTPHAHILFCSPPLRSSWAFRGVVHLARVLSHFSFCG